MKTKRSYKLYLQEIARAIETIESYIKDVSYDGFIKNQMMVDAVIRNLIIIGEAANHIPDEIQQKNTDINWNGIIGLRNLAVHEYFSVKLTIIWKIISQDLPTTKKQFLFIE